MLQIRNNTPFEADIALLQNTQGVDSLYPIIKATFSINDLIRIAEKQIPLYKKDSYRSEPTNSGISCLGDYHIAKVATDIIIDGDCIVSNGAEVSRCDVIVEINDQRKHLCVFGDRYWDNGNISSPAPFGRMPLIYERAYGGGYPAHLYEKNPIGIGFHSGRTASEMNGESLPNIEDPSALIRTAFCEPSPVGVAAVPPFWSPRSQHAGTYDDHWRCTRAPFLPADFNSEFLQCASSGLVMRPYLVGGEMITLHNMHENGVWQFTLPQIKLRCRVLWQNRLFDVALNLETLTLMPNDSVFTCTLRGEFPVNQWALRVDYVEFIFDGLSN